MGFIPERTVYRLTFDDVPEYRGAIVEMTGLSVGELLATMVMPVIPDVASLDASDPAAMAATVKVMEDYEAKTRQVYTTFAEHLVSWNVESAPGQPVPANLKGVLTQDDAFIKGCMSAWRTATQGVSADLKARSNGGVPSPELSLPMEPLSPSPTSSP